MISVNYLDSIVNGNLYSSVQLLKQTGSIICCFNITKWFGKPLGFPLENRGELIALASIVQRYRTELINVYSKHRFTNESTIDTWRSKYKNIKYHPQCDTIDAFLRNEILIVSENLQTISSSIMIKNFPSILFTENDKNVSLILGDDDLDFEKHIIAVISNSSEGLKVIGFRKAVSKSHLQEIIKQANTHNLLLYYSQFQETDKEIVAEGPWILLPASLRSFTPANKNVVQEVQEEPKKSTEKVFQEPSTKEDDIIIDEEGFACPFCEDNKRFKKRFGLTNHVNHLHPDKIDEYKRAYQC